MKAKTKKIMLQVLVSILIVGLLATALLPALMGSF
jgi:type II secretory pathway pseudopilin PulG